MHFPMSTGHAAQALGVIEPQLNDLIRRGKIEPRPPVVAARRLWEASHILQAAEHLGVLTDELRERLSGEEVSQ